MLVNGKNVSYRQNNEKFTFTDYKQNINKDKQKKL